MRKFNFVGKADYYTGNFYFTYWNDEKNKTIYNEKLTMDQALQHLIEKGYPFSINAELKTGNKTMCKLLMTQYDHEIEDSRYIIAQRTGSYIVQEEGIKGY
jgi:hypothetical protein